MNAFQIIKNRFYPVYKEEFPSCLPPDLVCVSLGFLMEETKNGIIFDDKKEGLWREWHDNGTLKSEEFFKNGEHDGIYREWYDNGTLKSEVFCIEGKLHGKLRCWDEKENLIHESTYHNGKKHGKYVDINGGFTTSGTYFNDKEEGEWKQYIFDELSEVKHYHDGKLHGIFQAYDSDNHLILETNWKEGKKDGLYRQWDRNLLISSEERYLVYEGLYKNGKKEGVWKEYVPSWNDNNGRLIEVFYNNGKKDGEENEDSESESTSENESEDSESESGLEIIINIS